MPHRHRPVRPFAALALALALAAYLLAAQPPARAAVAAPALKWQRGGCFASWCQTGWYSSPAVADLDGDGAAEVIWGSYDVTALNGEDGSLQWRAANGSRVWPGVAVADLTGDGSLEVVVGRGGDQLTVYSAAGATLWSKNPFGAGEVRSLAVADLDGDGVKEIVVGRAGNGATRQVHVFEASGAPRAGFPARRDGEQGYGWGMYNNNLAVGDLDGDGDAEIIAPTDTHYITALDRAGDQLPANPRYGAGKTWARVGVHVDDAVDLRGFANCGTEHRPNFANSAPTIADMDADGSPEVIVVGDVYDCAAGDGPGDLYNLPWIFTPDRSRWSGAGYDWTAIPAPEPGSAPLSQDYTVIETAAMNAVAADLDGDGLREILFPSYDGRLHAYWLDKTQRGAWPFDVPGTGIRFASEPAVADLDGDGTAEVIVASWPEKGGGRVGQLHILDWQGNHLHAVNLPAPVGGATWNGGLGAPTVANIDADADMEVVLGTASSGVVAYDLPGSAGTRCLWCTGRGSYARTGAAPGTESFTLRLEPAVARVEPGETASLLVRLGGEVSGSPVTLSATADRPGVEVTIVGLPSVSPPADVVLQVTHTGGGSGVPGEWYTVTVTASAGGITRTATGIVLVGGWQAHLPAVRR